MTPEQKFTQWNEATQALWAEWQVRWEQYAQLMNELKFHGLASLLLVAPEYPEVPDQPAGTFHFNYPIVFGGPR